MYRHVFLSVFVLSLLSIVSAAQAGGSYRIEKFVTPSGGTMTGGPYSSSATAGENTAGKRQTGGPYILHPGFWVPESFAPTAATVSVSGRVMTSAGAGLDDAIVTIINRSGQARIARSSSFGYYVIEEVHAGQTYIISVTSKSHQFVPRVAPVVDNVADFDFIALP